MAEERILELTHENKINGTILRISNAIGPPANKEANCWHLVANDFARQVCLESKIEIKSSSGITRDFIPIKSICSILLFLIKNKTGQKIINVASGKNITLKYLAQLITKEYERKSGLRTTIVENVTDNNLEKDKTIVINKIINELFKYEKDLNFEIKELINNCYNWFKRKKTYNKN